LLILTSVCESLPTVLRPDYDIGGMAGGVGVDGGMGGIPAGIAGANNCCNFCTCPAGVHAAMPCSQTGVCAVS
jgi:hypothetical protein